MSLKFGGVLGEVSKRREVTLEDDDAPSDSGPTASIDDGEDMNIESMLSPEVLAEMQALEQRSTKPHDSDNDEASKLQQRKEVVKAQAEVLEFQQSFVKDLLELRILYQSTVFGPFWDRRMSAGTVETLDSPEIKKQFLAGIETALGHITSLKSLLRARSGSTIDSEDTFVSTAHTGTALKRYRHWESDSEVPKKIRAEWIALEEEQRRCEASFIYPKIEEVRSSVDMLARGFTAFQQPIQQQVADFTGSRNFDALLDTMIEEKNGQRCFTDREYYRFLLRKFVASEAARSKTSPSTSFALDRRRTPSNRTKAERRSSKGKRVKFDPIPELVNFMHPKPVTLEESLMQKLTSSLQESLFLTY